MHLTRFAALAATLLAPTMATAGDLRADANAVFNPSYSPCRHALLIFFAT